jgi:Ca2+-binding RTX toxin-like protein
MLKKRWLLAFLTAMLLFSATYALATANSVTESGLLNTLISVTAQDIAPGECDGMSLAVIRFVTPGIPYTSTGNTNELIIGTPFDDDIRAGNGRDCILGGGGDDTIRGNQRDDVLLGGPDDDTLIGGNGNDVCYGGPGTDTFSLCETTIP